MPSIPALDHPLTDGRVGLRDAAERDIPEVLIAYQDDPTMYERLGLKRPPSGAELGRQMEEEAGERAAGRGARLTIVEAGSDAFRGGVRVYGIDWDNIRAELGVLVVPQMRRRGLAPAALRLASRWLFDSCGLQRAGLMTAPDNEAMLRAARAAGFVEEGLLRSYTLEGGTRRDMISLSLLPSDLEAGG